MAASQRKSEALSVRVFLPHNCKYTGEKGWHKSLHFRTTDNSAMVFAEDIRKIILKIADERGPDNTFGPRDVAQRVDIENWESLIDQVSLVATILEKEGKITTTTSGDQIDFRKHESKPSLKKSA